MRPQAFLLASLALLGCARSHDTTVDGSSPPIRIDGGPAPVGCTSDADCGGGLVCTAGACRAPAGPGETRRYQVHSFAPAEVVGDRGLGFDLDGVVSTGAGTTCVDLTPDLISIHDGSPGVDDALASIVPQIGMLLGDTCPPGTPASDCVRAVHDAAIARGSIDIEIQVSGIHSYSDDASVEVEVRVWGGVVGRASGAILGGRLRVAFRMMRLPMILVTPEPELLTLHGAVVGGAISPMGITSGDVGGGLSIEELAERADLLMPGIGDTIRSVLYGIADLAPRAADPTTCDQLSAGFGLEAHAI